MDRISELPQGILQRILYSLSQEEAARTSVLSKSWRNIWCTRPNLDFSISTYKGNEQEFVSTVDKILQRYCDHMLCLEELHLSIKLGDYWQYKSVSFLERWIRLLTTMGGVKDFRLSIWLEGNYLTKKFFESILLCKHLRTIKLNDHLHKNLKSFSFELRYSVPQDICSIEIHPSSLIETFKITGANVCFQQGADFRNLKDLSLCDVKSSFGHLSSCKFPNLQFLKISYCDGLEEIELFIDAPNISSFDYGGVFVPSISFATTFGEWKSVIDIIYKPTNDGSSWFLKLKQLLKSLSLSEISLNISEHCNRIREDILVQDNVYNKPTVENLNLRVDFSSLSCLVNGVFGICRPRNVSNDLGRWDWMESVAYLWDTLIDRENTGDQLLLRALEQVRLEMKEKNRDDWRPTKLTKLMANGQRLHFRFVLKWAEAM